MPLIKSGRRKPPSAPEADPGLIYIESQRWWPQRADAAINHSNEFLRSVRSGKERISRTKSYPFAKTVELKPDFSDLDVSLRDVLASRRSGFLNAGGPLSFVQLSNLLIGSFGQQSSINTGSPSRGWHRTVPSPGGIFSTEIYYLSLRTQDLDFGLYHFDPLTNRLQHLPTGAEAVSYGGLFTDAGAADSLRSAAAGVIFLTSVFGRMRKKYGHRYLRFCLLEAGCVCQNLDLVARALNVTLWHQGSVVEDKARSILRVDGRDEAVVHSAIVQALGADTTEGEQAGIAR